MTVVIWLAEGTWPACVDAARELPAGAVRLLHVVDAESVAAIDGAHAGLLGRADRFGRAGGAGGAGRAERAGRAGGAERAGRAEGAEGAAGAEMLARTQAALLDAAAARFGRPAERDGRSGRIEREVVAACADADLLILARDGDRTRLGPKSLGPATRFVLDHAPCRVLLVWPDEPPGLATLPPPPP
jgi:nucleotide-binding universal stress UspA family protein